eukprot:gene54440-72750_t
MRMAQNPVGQDPMDRDPMDHDPATEGQATANPVSDSISRSHALFRKPKSGKRNPATA